MRCDVRAAFVAAIALLGVASPLPLSGQTSDRGTQAISRDIDQIRKARRNQGELHRGVVDKWRAVGKLAELLAVYESQNAASTDNAFLAYGYGYALALRAGEGDLQRAADVLSRASSLDATFVLARFSLAGVQHLLGNTEAALAAYSECVRIDPAYVAAYHAMGEVYRSDGDYADALESYDLALANAPADWARPHYGKGTVLLAMGSPADADRELTLAIALDKSHGPSYMALAQARAALGQVPEAVELFRTGASLTSPTRDNHWGLARALAGGRHWEEAEREYAAAIRLDDDAAELHLEFGDVLWAQARRDEAGTEYRTAVGLEPELGSRFTDPVRDGFFAARVSEPEARDLLEKALTIRPDDASVHELYGDVEAATSHPAEALASYRRATELDPQRTQVWVRIGDLLLADHALNEARDAYARASSLSPNLPEEWSRASAAELGSERYAAALNGYGRCLLLAPDDPSLRYGRARALEGLGRTDQAVAAYEELDALHSDYSDTLNRLAGLYRALDDPERSLAVLDRIVSLRPDDVPALRERASLLRELGKNQEATDAFRRLTAAAPDDVDTFAALAELTEEADPTAAIRAYRRVTELAPDRAGAHFSLARLLLSSGDEQGALVPLEHGLDLEPRRAREQFMLGELLAKRRELALAVPHLAIACEIEADNAEWQALLARTAEGAASGDVGDASRERLLEIADSAYSAAIRIQPTASALFRRAVLRREHRQIGERLYLSSEIAEDFKQAASMDSNNPDATYLLALTYLDMESSDLAATTLRDLLKARPKYPNANAELGKLAEASNRFDEAIRYYAREIVINPKSFAAHYRLGFLKANSQGDMTSAIDHLSRAVSLDPSHVNAHIEYGMVLYRVDRVAGAAEQFEMAIRLAPDNLTANYNLALMYQLLGKDRLAIERWRHLLSLDLPGEWVGEARTMLEKLERSSSRPGSRR